MLEEERYILFLLFRIGIEFPSVTREATMFIRNNVTRLMSNEGKDIQYILNHGMENELVLNTVEEYNDYLKEKC